MSVDYCEQQGHRWRDVRVENGHEHPEWRICLRCGKKVSALTGLEPLPAASPSCPRM